MVLVNLKNITTSKAYSVEISSDASIRELRSNVQQEPDFAEHSAEDLQLILNGKYLEDSGSIADLNLPEGHTIFVLIKKQEPELQRPPSSSVGDEVAPTKPTPLGKEKSVRSTMRQLTGKEKYTPGFSLPSMDDPNVRYLVGFLAILLGYAIGAAFLWAVAISTKIVYTNLNSGGVGPVVGVCFAFLILAAIFLIAVAYFSDDGVVAVVSCTCCMALIICVFVLGCAAGRQYYDAAWISAAPSNTATNPARAYDGVSRSFTFVPGTYVDVNRGAWQLVRSGKSSVSYCVAPVVLDPSVAGQYGVNFTSVSGQQDQIAYWVYGKGTCCSNSAYKCPYWRSSARAGVLTPESKSTWESRIRPMALAAWRLSLLPNPQFVQWTDDIDAELGRFNKQGDVLTGVFTWGWPTMFLGSGCLVFCFAMRFR